MPPSTNIPIISDLGAKQTLLNYNNNSTEVSNQPGQTFNTPHQYTHPEAARLQSVISNSVPSAYTPYKALICPLNSAFTNAFMAFRYAFRDLTLLNWEERFDHNKKIQKARAKELSLEPYVYSRPAPGMPDGRRPQINYTDAEGETGGKGYTRNSFNLPGLDSSLGKEGLIGRELLRDEDKRRMEEDAIQKEEMRMNRRAQKEKERKPLFNYTSGHP